MARLSVCLIARNEQENLPGALASVREVADEIVVVDTGSTDATADVAQQHGAVLGRFAWRDDFAAARNAALDLATGDWVLWLDADERLMPGSGRLVRRAMGQDDALGHLVVRRDLVRKGEPHTYTQMWQLRLFRRRDDLRFLGRCHPDFRPSLHDVAAAEKRVVPPSAITLEHHGYTAELRRAKLERGRRLLELELRDRPGQLYYLIELFRTQWAMGEKDAGWATFHDACAALQPHLNDDRPPIAPASLLLETLLQLPAAALPHGLDPAQVRALAQRWHPDAPPLIWLMAQQDFAAERFEDAANRLQRLVTMGRTGRYDLTCSFDPRIVTEDAKLNLAACWIRLARLDDAERALRQLQHCDRLAQQVAANLRTVADLRRRAGLSTPARSSRGPGRGGRSAAGGRRRR